MLHFSVRLHINYNKKLYNSSLYKRHKKWLIIVENLSRFFSNKNDYFFFGISKFVIMSSNFFLLALVWRICCLELNHQIIGFIYKIISQYSYFLYLFVISWFKSPVCIRTIKAKKKNIVFIYEPSINLNRIIKKTKKHKQCHKNIRKNKISHRNKN